MTYKVSINGEQSERFIPKRGVRQTNLISPYIFILCASVISYLFHIVELNNDIQRIKLSKHVPSISHLLYDDNLVLSFKTSYQSCQKINHILQTFQGLKINK